MSDIESSLLIIMNYFILFHDSHTYILFYYPLFIQLSLNCRSQEWSNIENQLHEFNSKVQQTDSVLNLNADAEDEGCLEDNIKKLIIFQHGLNQIKSGMAMKVPC